MSGLAPPLLTWAEILQLPQRPEDAQRYELHDGEVVIVPPARPRHIKLERRIERFLEERAGRRGVVTKEFPYRPAMNLQCWFADVAYIPATDWIALSSDGYPVYAPPLIVEVLSPSNRSGKINRQRMIAMSAGTQEFWIVNGEERTVEVTRLDGWHKYGAGDAISAPWFDGPIAVDDLFAIDEI